MNSEISEFIKQIKVKFIDLNDKLINEITITKLQKEELTELNNIALDLKNKLAILDSEKKELENKNIELESTNLSLTNEIQLLNDKKNESISNHKDEEEIDELVREIDYCIKKLKNS
jgi:hypothetical protein